MLVVVTGISHKTATLELRERLALDEQGALRMAQELLDGGAACEALALSTCNRTELYLYGRDSLAGRQASVERLAKHAGVPPGELEASRYRGLLDNANTVRIVGKVLPPQKWHADQDGTQTPALRAKRVYITG